MKKKINYIFKIIKEEKNILRFIMLLFIIGIIAGSLFINFININDRKIVVEQVTEYFNEIRKLTGSVHGFSYFKSILINNYLQILILYLLGISIIGALIAILIVFFKGFLLGTTLSTIILKYKIKGILGCILYIVPGYVFNIFIYFFITLYIIKTSIIFIKGLINKSTINFKTFLGKYILSFIISICFITLICWFEAYITPLLLKLFTKI